MSGRIETESHLEVLQMSDRVAASSQLQRVLRRPPVSELIGFEVPRLAMAAPW